MEIYGVQTGGRLIIDLCYAGATVIVINSESNHSEALKRVGKMRCLKLSSKKTKWTSVGVSVNGDEIESMMRFVTSNI